MNSIGETLRRERLRHNLSLEEVSRETRIGLKFLQAIEAEDFTKLPGGVFARSFVRQYARLVGLDDEELAAEVQRRFQPVPAPPEERPARIASGAADRAAQGGRLGGIALALGLVAAGARAGGGGDAGLLAGLRLVAEVAASGRGRAASRGVHPGSHTAACAGPAPAPPQQPAAAPPSPRLRRPRRPAPSTAASAERQPVADAPPASNAPVQVLLTADEATWVSARSDGKFIYAGTLQPKETKGLEANEQVRLVLGNAGGVVVTLNGKPVPPLGPRGQVRTVQLSSGGVQIVPPKPREEVSDPL